MMQGGLEGIPIPLERTMSELEMRIMADIVRSIRVNGFSTAKADWQMQRMIQLGESEENIKQWIREALEATDEELDHIFSDTVYEQYYGYQRAYGEVGRKQIPFAENLELQALLESVKVQTKAEFRNITNSLGFVIRDPGTGKICYHPLMQFYRETLDGAVMDIVSGAVSYDAAVGRAINAMTDSGLRTVYYDSGHSNRVEVAVRRAVMTGFRQVQGKINEQAARDLGTDVYEVTYHVGARPEHQVWQGKVYTYAQLQSVCGLGLVTGLHGANCYHDYHPFIPGVSVRNYTDEELDEMMEEENTPKEYQGKEYTAYQALQKQRQMERGMRKTRQDIKLLLEGDADEDGIILKKARYQGQMQQYKAFSKAMKLPEQMQRVYQDVLGKVMQVSNNKHLLRMKISIPDNVYEKSKMTKVIKYKIDNAIKKLEREYNIYLDKIEGEFINSQDVFLTGGYIDNEGLLKHCLIINYKKDFVKLEKKMEKLYNEGKMAGKNFEDYIAHEMAHILPFQNCVTAEDYRKVRAELKQQFVRGVSGYADKSEDGAESLAEAFVKYRNGEKIPNESRKLIEKYISPWRREYKST